MTVLQTYSRQVVLPTLSDFDQKDRTRATLARGRLAPYWDLIVRAESFIHMEGAIRLDHPAVSGLADEIRHLWEAETSPPDWSYVKQFTGTVAAYVCELNGYQQVLGGNSPLKRKVGRPHWNVGQVLATA